MKIYLQQNCIIWIFHLSFNELEMIKNNIKQVKNFKKYRC